MPNSRALADYTTGINHRRGMCMVAQLFHLEIDRPTLFLQRLLARLEDLQDSQSASAMSPWLLACLDAVEEVLALTAERSFLREFEELAPILLCHWNTFAPVDSVRV